MAEISKKLRDLINGSPTLDTIEKQHWLEILPDIEQKHADTLEHILQDEKTKLAELDKKYKNARYAIENGEIQKCLSLIEEIC